jgi:tetratricopeptide (TPR) repeat protein
MSKKAKSSKQKKSIITNPSPADKQIDLIERQIIQENYAEAVTLCERLLNYLPPYAPQRVDALMHLGTAQAMQQNYPQSYRTFTEALKLAPNDADLWYNRGMSSQYTLRVGQSLKDFTRAVELNKRDELKEQFDDALKFSQKMAKESIKLRGPNFTLDQLIEQENFFQQGLELMEAEKWEEAEQAFQASIALGDCLPQPWGNLGVSLMMQERYDEAEAALKRALVIDPGYTIAKNNLKTLAKDRRFSLPKTVQMQEPFKGSKTNQSIIFIKE